MWQVYAFYPGGQVGRGISLDDGAVELTPSYNAVLPSGAYDAWLDPDADKDRLIDLMIPYPGDDLQTYPVSRFVNSPYNNDERCIEPAA